MIRVDLNPEHVRALKLALGDQLSAIDAAIAEFGDPTTDLGRLADQLGFDPERSADFGPVEALSHYRGAIRHVVEMIGGDAPWRTRTGLMR